MAQPISPEIWMKAGITDNRLLPGRYSTGIFTGKGVNIANNQEAYAYDDILVSDRIFDYDDRRLNGLHVPATAADSHAPDGWGASAYGPFQTVRFTRRVFTSGQHKSIAWRVFDEKQYSGAIGNFGAADHSDAISGGEAYMSTAETINRAKKIWEAEILGPHIDKYNFFAIANGHIAGRFVQTNAGTGAMFDGVGTWIASPGPYEGMSYPPEFAPIKAIEWDSLNVRPMLNAIGVAWTNLFIPPDNRVILLDGSYKDDLLSNLIGVAGTMPVGDKAYDALVEGRFERFMGWDFDFTIPSQYYPKVYVDENNNVCHTAAGTAAYDAVINSIDGGDGRNWLTTELAASQRQRATNYIGTIYNESTHAFENIVTNYPGNGNPSNVSDALGAAVVLTDANFAVHADATMGALDAFPWQGWPGQGLPWHDSGFAGAVTGPVGSITQKQVIGMAVYRPAAQLGQEYGAMETDRGKTRGKFTELVFDMKHDAWVIPQFSHGILLIVDSTASTGQPSLKVEFVNDAYVTAVNFVTAAQNLAHEATLQLVWDIDGMGNFERDVQFTSSDATHVAVNASTGLCTAGTADGAATITITAVGNTDLTDTVVITSVAE